MGNEVDDSVILTVPGPVPDCGETVSQLVFWFAGNLAMVHGCPAGRFTTVLTVVDWPGARPRGKSVFETESVPGFCAGGKKGTERVVFTVLPWSSTPSIS